MFKKFVKMIKESVQEALEEAYEELVEEERERAREIECCEHEMEIAEGGFHECLEMIDMPKEQKEELARWFGRYASNAREVIKMERQG